MIIPTSFFVSLVCVVIHQGAADSANTHFENRVRPILAERCWKCHGPETARSGLRLDSAAGLKRGGKQGPVIDLDRPADSRILKAIARQGELKMPPDGSLSPAQLADMRSWVMQGSVFPESCIVQLPVSGPESDHLSGATESGSVDPAASRVERKAGELSLIGSAGIFP